MLENLKNALKKNYKFIILLMCLIVVLAIVEDVFDKETIELDLLIYKLVVQNMRNNILTNIFKFVTNLGGAYFLIAISILSLIFVKNKKISFAICINLVLVTILNLLLKNIVERPRPIGYRLIDETGYSFPSGHSMISCAFYGLIIYFIWKNIKNNKVRNASCVLLGILILLIGISRIYLGVHYATDVLGGFLISVSYLIIFTSTYKVIFNNDN
ncbi:MAG: phosphatase PAP2 family protein [Clostridia bacterium]|nr:phosphatase PAP2 family protein [Clostridia bacterium]